MLSKVDLRDFFELAQVFGLAADTRATALPRDAHPSFGQAEQGTCPVAVKQLTEHHM